MGVPTAAVSAAQQVRQEQQQRKQQRATERATQPGQQQPATQQPAQRPSPPGRTRATRPRGPRGSGPRTGKALHLAGKAGGGVLLAEYLAGALIISSSIITKGPNKGYLEVMSQILLRLTALTAIFFTLFLAAGSAKAGKAAAWFGLLVDLGILFTAVKESQLTVLLNVVKGIPTGVDQTTLTKATTVAEPTPESLPS